jgi:hypothetical protein
VPPDGAKQPSASDSAVRDEVQALLTQIRRWQLAQVQLHDQILRCFDLRRRFEGGAASVSLRELSLEVEEQCRRGLALHQTLRGQHGCPSLAL